MKRSRFTDSQIMAVWKQAEAGTPVPALCREHGVSSTTFYKWRAKFGDMDVSLMAKMKELEDENRRLKKVYVDAHMRFLIVEEALAKNSLAISAARDGHAIGSATRSGHQSGMYGVWHQ